MIRKISSEFDSIDSAERAVAAIKKSIPDINRVSIKPKSNDNGYNNDNNMYNSGFLGFTANGQFLPFGTNLYGMQPVDKVSNPNSYSQPQEVILQIACANDEIKNVSSMLTNYGGLQIKEQ